MTRRRTASAAAIWTLTLFLQGKLMTTYLGTSGNDDINNSTNDVAYLLDGDDYFNSSFAGFPTIYGGQGNDLLSLGDGSIAGQGGWLYGGNGGDFLVGGVVGDQIYGGADNDILIGGRAAAFTPAAGAEFADDTGFASGNDWLEGGAGVDALYGFDGNDYLYGGQGSDSGTVAFTTTGTGVKPNVKAGLFGGEGTDYLYGGEGNDYLDGGADSDTLYGGEDNDTMYGGAGTDTIYAESGFDTVYGGAGADHIYGGRYILATEHIVAEGNAGDDFVFAGDNNDIIYGDDAANTQTGNDFIWAGGGSDWLIGGNGTDVLIGSTGNDYYYGGAGTDYYDLALGDVNAGDADYIYDLTPGTDYVALPYIALGNVTFGVSGGFAYGYIPEAGGTAYYFLAQGITAAQLQAATIYI
jgi:Ca2+-binding RTX toxin-like protein